MGLYLDPNPAGFVEAVQSEIYVDKSELIKYRSQQGYGTLRRG